MMRKFQILTVCMLLFTFCGATVSFAQVQYSKEQKRIKKQADFYYSYGDYLNAFDAYKRLYYLDSVAPKMNFKMGICMLVLSTDLSKSTEYFKIANDNGNIESSFYLGNWYHLQNDFDKAIEFYQKYIIAEGAKAIKKPEIDRRIATSERARKMMTDPVDVRIENMGKLINSKYPEYVPLISADESVLIFTSRRKGGVTDELDSYGKYYEDIYISYKENKKWLPPVGIGSNINTEGYDACVGLSSDGTTLITYKGSETGEGGDLYYSTLEGDIWQKPVKYGPNINSDYSEFSASLSSDGNILYFSSNRPGGFGGLDIYRVVRFLNGEWSLPVNLGPSINTEYDDDAPFIHPDNVSLYFSSQGHGTMGGYDIFKSDRAADSSWSQAENLGYPINTTDDDIYFVLSADGRRGYYSSRQIGGEGEQDLYVMHLASEFKELTIIKGFITSADSLETPLKAKITLRDYKTKKIKAIYNSNSKTGKYMLVIL